jgi:hypothetical protein
MQLCHLDVAVLGLLSDKGRKRRVMQARKLSAALRNALSSDRHMLHVRLRTVVRSRLFASLCVLLVAADLIALVVLLSGTLIGRDVTAQPRSSGLRAAPLYGADVRGVSARRVDVKFLQVDNDHWKVGLMVHVPMRPGKSDRFVDCRYVVPAGSEPVTRQVTPQAAVHVGPNGESVVKEFRRQSLKLIHEDRSFATWSLPCMQASYDPTPNPAHGRAIGGSNGIWAFFTVPDEVLRRSVGDQWALTFSVSDDPGWVPGMPGYSNSAPVTVTYKVTSRNWVMQSFTPGFDRVLTSTPAALVAERTGNPEALSSDGEVGIIYVALADPTSTQRKTAAISVLSFLLPVFGRGTTPLFQHKEPAGQPKRGTVLAPGPKRSKNSRVRTRRG